MKELLPRDTILVPGLITSSGECLGSRLLTKSKNLGNSIHAYGGGIGQGAANRYWSAKLAAKIRRSS